MPNGTKKHLIMKVSLCVLVFMCLALSPALTEKPKKHKQPREKKTVTVTYVNKRLRSLERQVQSLEEKLNQLDPGAFADEPPCPNNQEGFFQNEALKSCYRLEPETVLVNWTTGQSLCQSYHPKAHLVAIETEEEQVYLKRKWMIERGVGSVFRYWTDAVYHRPLWVWDNINRPMIYDHWIPTTSHDDDRFTCMAVYSNEAFYWGDVACWAPHMVVCEINL